MLTWNETKKVKRKQLELWNISSESKSEAHRSTKKCECIFAAKK